MRLLVHIETEVVCKEKGCGNLAEYYRDLSHSDAPGYTAEDFEDSAIEYFEGWTIGEEYADWLCPKHTQEAA